MKYIKNGTNYSGKYENKSDPNHFTNSSQEVRPRSGRIIQGIEADYGEWPWQISIRKWKKGIHLLNGNSLMFAYFSTQKCFLFCFKISMEHTFINVVVFC